LGTILNYLAVATQFLRGFGRNRHTNLLKNGYLWYLLFLLIKNTLFRGHLGAILSYLAI